LRSENPLEDPGARRARGFPAVAVVGLGLIGGSLALALRRAGYRGRVLGISRQETIEEALRQGAIDEGFGYGDLPRAAAKADLIVLSGPILSIVEHLRVLAGAPLRPGTVVSDVGSTKREILAAAERLPAGVHFVGGHPMAGSEKRGLGAADPFLFQNAYYVLTRGPRAPAAEVERLGEFLGAMTGARMVALEAEDHDRIAAAISHLPQLLAVSLVNSLEELGPHRETGVRLAAGGFRDMTRIASSPFDVWRDIVETNRGPILEALTRFSASLGALRDLLEKGEAASKTLERDFGRAAATRAAIPRDTKGFLRPLSEVLVVVEDRPGMIAGIAGALAQRGINIQDIEVLKVREGEGGSLRLAFRSREVAQEALGVLAGAGFTARLSE
jgi:prephenate dehydrogenase